MKMGKGEHWLSEQLQTVYDRRESSTIAAWVFEKVTGLSRIDRLTRRDELLQVAQLRQLTTILQRMQQHEPVQYVLGEAYFHGLKLYVDRNVLIPRPETEELVEWVLTDVRTAGIDVFERERGQADKTRSLKILDVGTGSGCIALALKKEMPKAELWACDKDDDALNVARRNGAMLDIRVDFQNVDFLDAAQWNSLPAMDLVVSNPPYITHSELNTLQRNVAEHEPHTALFVPDDNPLVFYKALAQFGKEKLHGNGIIYAEIHEDYGQAVVQLFQMAMYAQVEVRKDMQGKNRMVKASL